MTIPEKGTSITASGLAERAEDSVEVTVLHDDAGLAVSVNEEIVGASSPAAQRSLADSQAPRRGATRQATPAKCSPDAPWQGNKWWNDGAYRWGYNPSGESGGGREAVQLAAQRVADGSSAACGDDNTRLTMPYVGDTADRPQITSAGECTGNDGKSVVGYGPVDGTLVAWACWTTSNNGMHLIAADILFDTSNRAWFTSRGACSAQHDLTSVGMHEFGHAAGLSHTPDPENRFDQMMKPNIRQCSLEQRDMGRGDLNGLFALYGP